MKTILITGGAGFIGSNFIEYFLEKYEDYFILNLDKLTYAGDLNNTKEFSENKNYKFVKGDVANKELVNFLFKEYKIEGVIHFAAESHVDNSINGPEIFVETNISGTLNLLEAAKLHWLDESFNAKTGFENARFHHISTDEVYGSLGKEGFFTEETPYAPNNPYSASKASSDFLVRSFINTYNLNAVITNCSNNFGPKQHDEKLIPTVIRKCLLGEPIPIYGAGKNIRDWLFVEDHCKAIDVVFHKSKKGKTYNIGGGSEKTNIDLCVEICKTLDSLKPKLGGKPYKEQISFVKDRAGHDLRYAINSEKIERELSWETESSFEDSLMKTVKWYVKKYS